MWPPFCIRSKSYSLSISPEAAVRGSMTVFSGSSISSITWGSSMGALRRTRARGGMRSSTVPSVARIRAPEPGVKS